jgi:hypothetical protein
MTGAAVAAAAVAAAKAAVCRSQNFTHQAAEPRNK